MWIKAAVVILAIAGAANCRRPVSQTKSTNSPKIDLDAVKWLLPTDIVPDTYDLRLKTYIEKFETANFDFSYDGTVSIHVTVAKDTDKIVLHRHPSITISAATLTKDGDDTQIGDLEFDIYDEETNKQTLHTADNTILATGDNYTVDITFKGIHGEDMRGFYRSYYNDDEGKNHWIITTQFESYDARRAFPCFDEPKYKAKYTIHIDVNTDLIKAGYSVLSNTLQTASTDNAGTTTVEFNQSPTPISSYLVAFIVSDFKPTSEAKFNGDKPFKTWGREKYINASQGSFSQSAGPKALDVLSNLLQRGFEYEKMDQVGIPDFSAGAMENWGLCTYRERMLFFNEKFQTSSTLQTNIGAITHELAHQYFGDLVTLWWWSDIWLNEGFATFFEYHATAQIKTDDIDATSWNMIEQMVTDEVQAGAMTFDAETSSNPLTMEVYAPGDIDARFDDISYSKGGSILRMWMHALGEEVFYTALKNYLEANAGNVATPQALFDSFKASTDNPSLQEDVIYTDWTTQPGYPVVTATRNGDSYVLEQERFLASGEVDVKLKWTIPISYTTSEKHNFNDTTPTVFFESSDANVSIPHDNATWVLLNIQETGFYRVNYDNETWLALTETLHTNKDIIGNINRAQLIDDALWLARSTNGYLTYDVALNLTNFLEKEEDLIPWKSAFNGFNFLYSRLAASDIGGKLVSFMTKLLTPQFNRLTLLRSEQDTQPIRVFRSLVASWSCKLGIEECVDGAVDQFGKLEDVEGDVKSTVLCTAIREGDETEWNAVWSLFNSTTDNAEQTLYISALGCTTNTEILESYLNKTIKGDEIRRQDKIAAFQSVYNGHIRNVPVALKFVVDNLDAIPQSYGSLDSLGSVLTGIATKLATKEDLDTMQKIKTTIDGSETLKPASLSAAAAVAIVDSNVEWVANKNDEISAWLEINGAGINSITVTALLLSSIVALIVR